MSKGISKMYQGMNSCFEEQLPVMRRVLVDLRNFKEMSYQFYKEILEHCDFARRRQENIMEKEYQLQVTENGKAFVLPKELREELPNIFYVTRAVSKLHKKSVYLFTEEEWQAFEEKLHCLPPDRCQERQFAKYFLSSSCNIELEDGVLRLSEFMLDFLCEGGIQEGDKVYIAFDLEEEPRYCSRLLWVDKHE